MRVLIDLDDVVTDLQGRIEAIWHSHHPDIELFPSGERRSYYIGAALDGDGVEEIWHILHGPGFFASLDPIDGALESLEKMLQIGLDVFIVTSAGTSFPLAATEKYQWVQQHCGHHMLSRLVITPAKYLIKGDVLIDDKPEIESEDKASWEHILFDKTYNRDITSKRRLNWDNWQDFLLKK